MRYFTCVIATVIGLSTLAATVAVTLGERRTKLVPGGRLVALHGELGTRTRHVMRALAGETSAVDILVLGRPRRRLRATAVMFQKELKRSDIRLHRPFDLRSAVAAAADVFACLLTGARLVKTSAYVPDVRTAGAIMFRMLLGSVSARWEARRPATHGTVIFGHTGVGDSTGLERAMQAKGTRTVHWLHGFSAGRMFSGFSDLGLFKCGHDAALHASFHDYRHVTAIPAPRHSLAPRGADLLLLTNLIHPMNEGYRLRGIADEIAALQIAAEAARLHGPAAGKMLWKPHPVIGSLPADVVESARREGERLGFTLLPHDRPVDLARAYGWVICTPSTTAVDALLRGQLPIILTLVNLEQDSALSRFPLRAGNPHDLQQAMAEVCNDSRRASLYGHAWDAVRPGAEPTLEQIISLAQGVSFLPNCQE